MQTEAVVRLLFLYRKDVVNLEPKKNQPEMWTINSLPV